jgi:hypothetical protein
VSVFLSDKQVCLLNFCFLFQALREAYASDACWTHRNVTPRSICYRRTDGKGVLSEWELAMTKEDTEQALIHPSLYKF